MRFAIALCAVSIACAQTTRTFRLKHAEHQGHVQEFASVLRVIGNLQAVSPDAANRAITISGTPQELAAAAWLVRRMDLPAHARRSRVQEYRSPTGEVIGVFHLAPPATPQDVQDVAMIVHVVGFIRRVGVYNPPGEVFVRATRTGVASTAWLMDRLNAPPAAPAAAPLEYRLATEVVRVFQLRYPPTRRQLQEIEATLRAVADIPAIFSYSSRGILAVRAPAERVALAGWVVERLDQPLDRAPVPAGEYHFPAGPDTAVRVFFLRPPLSPQRLQEAASRIRRELRMGRVMDYLPLRAISARGTPAQVTAAERLLDEMKAR